MHAQTSDDLTVVLHGSFEENEHIIFLVFPIPPVLLHGKMMFSLILSQQSQ
jgi:hypothetical protein